MASKKASSTALSLLLAGSSQAVIQYVNNPAGASVGMAGSDPVDYLWDVDNNGTTDFRLQAKNDYVVGSFMYLQMGNHSGVTNSMNAFLIGDLSKNIFRVPQGKLIGSASFTTTAKTNFGGTYTYRATWPATASLSGRAIFSHEGELATLVNYSNALLSNFQTNPIDAKTIFFTIGFRFIGSDAQTHYGWASIAMNGYLGDADHSEPQTVITSWAYQDEANTPIAAGQIPEPAVVATGLGALALGAAGLRRWRKQRA